MISQWRRSVLVNISTSFFPSQSEEEKLYSATGSGSQSLLNDATDLFNDPKLVRTFKETLSGKKDGNLERFLDTYFSSSVHIGCRK